MSLIGNKLILIFKLNSVVIANEIELNLEDTNIPKKEFNSPAYWIVEPTNYNPMTNTLRVKILEYHVGEIEVQSLPPDLFIFEKVIKRLVFESIDTIGLINTVRGTRNFSYNPKPSTTHFVVSKNKNSNNYSLSKNKKENQLSKFTLSKLEKENNQSEKENNQSENYFGLNKSQAREYEKNFAVKWKDVFFHTGYVTIKYKILPDYNDVEFRIENEFLKSEFESIKNYFPKVLNNNYVLITSKIKIVDNKIESSSAISNQINSINEDIIEKIRIDILKYKIRQQKNEQEIIDAVNILKDDKNEKLNMHFTFYNNLDNIIKDVSKIYNSKHYKQLLYLSKRNQNDIMKIKFITNPISFLFLIDSEKYYYFIWETVNTEEATYIWVTNNNPNKLKEEFGKIKSKLKEIMSDGKRDYLIKNQKHFRRIIHNYSDLRNGFNEWKNKLEKLIV